MAMNDIFNLYMKAENFSSNSTKVYTRNINECLSYINKPENNITELDLLDWKESLDGKSSATIAQKVTCAKTYFRFLKKHKLIESNPAEDLGKVHVQNKEKHHMTAEQVHDMMNACKDIKYRAIVSLFASSGMRVSELTSVSLNAYKAMRYSGEHKMYIIGKGNKKAPVIFNEQSCELIDRYLKVRDDCGSGCDCLFVSSKGHQIARSGLSESLKVIARDAGIPWWNEMCNHQLRAATATVLSDKGLPVAQIRDVMRHSSINTTNRYIKTSENVIEANVMDMSF